MVGQKNTSSVFFKQNRASYIAVEEINWIIFIYRTSYTEYEEKVL